MKYKACPSCGGPLTDPKRRSSPQHRRVWGILDALWDGGHWPESAYKAGSKEELRAYLLIKAGWYELRIHVGKGPHWTPKNSITIEDESGVKHTYTPKSTRFSKMSQANATKVYNALQEIVQATVGVTCDQLLDKRNKAA